MHAYAGDPHPEASYTSLSCAMWLPLPGGLRHSGSPVATPVITTTRPAPAPT